MTEVGFIALIGLLTTLLGYLFGKKKRTVETSILETDLQKKIHETYQQIISDTNRSLGYYIKLSEDTSKTVSKMEETINAILEDVCIKKNCKYRQYHQSVQVKREMARVQKEEEDAIKVKENIQQS